MSGGPWWGLSNFELALKRWERNESPDISLIAAAEEWADQIQYEGLPESAVVNDEDDFVVRIGETNIFASGTVAVYERMIIVNRIEGT